MGQIIKSLASCCLSVCLSALFRSQLLFGLHEISTEVGGPKWVKIRSYLSHLPQFSPYNAFSIERSEHRSDEARGPIAAVKRSNDVPAGERLYAQSSKML